jgi:hypothetical protein
MSMAVLRRGWRAGTGKVHPKKVAAMLQSQPQALIPIPNADIDRRRRIRDLNDTFRRQQSNAAFMLGEFFKTPRIMELPWGEQWAIVDKVKKFEYFDLRLDPNELHDFGAFVHKDQRIFWKIDYIDPKLTRRSDDPSDPERTVRMLTIHLAEDPQ